MKRILNLLLIASFFAILTILLFKDVIFSDSILSFRDLGRFFYPPREFAFNLLKNGTIPFWNPYILCGNPLIASHQPAVFYPVSLVYLAGDFLRMYNIFIYLHFILAGIFMYIFLKGEKFSRMASLVSAVSFTFSGYMYAAVNVLTFFSSGIWLPITLWAVFKYLNEEKFPYLALSAFFLGMMFLAGEPMILYMTMGIIFCYGCMIKKLKPIFFIFILFLLLFAFQILPVAELLIKSDRMRMTYTAASTWSIAPYNFLNLLFPAATDIEMALRGYWEKQSWLLDYYLGLFPLIMFPAAVFLAKNKKKGFILSILAVSVILSLGKYTPVYKLLFNWLPGFSFFRYPVKYFYLTTFSFCWLAAMGYDYYEKNVKENVHLKLIMKRLLYFALALSLPLVLLDRYFMESVEFLYKNWAVYIQRSMKDGVAFVPYISLGMFTLRRTLIFVLTFIVFLFFGTQKKIRTFFVSLAVLALVVADLFSANSEINLYEPFSEFKKATPNIEFLMQDKGLFRILSSPQNNYFLFNPTRETYKDYKIIGKERLYTNRMMEFGIYDINGYEAVARGRMGDLLSFINHRVKSPDDTNLLSALNIKYIASPKKLDLKGYDMVKESLIANIYQNKNVLPRAFLSDNAYVERDKFKIFQKFLDKKWDPEKEVILEEEPVGFNSRQPIAESRKPYDRVDIISYKPNEVTIGVLAGSPKFLVLSDSYYPGWRAYIDGNRAKIYEANYVMRAVYIKPGTHEVKFIFVSLSFWIGLAISLISLVILASYLALRKKV